MIFNVINYIIISIVETFLKDVGVSKETNISNLYEIDYIRIFIFILNNKDFQKKIKLNDII